MTIWNGAKVFSHQSRLSDLVPTLRSKRSISNKAPSFGACAAYFGGNVAHRPIAKQSVYSKVTPNGEESTILTPIQLKAKTWLTKRQ